MATGSSARSMKTPKGVALALLCTQARSQEVGR